MYFEFPVLTMVQNQGSYLDIASVSLLMNNLYLSR